MKRKSGLTGSLLVIVILIYVSCRKTDHPLQNEIQQPVLRFFNLHQSSDPGIKAIANLLMQENKKYDFINSITSTVGYPYWDKTIRIKGKNSMGRGSTGDSADFYYIPFVRDSQNYVNSSLIVKTTSTDTTVRWLSDWQYAGFGFDTTNANAPNARKDFLTLANLERTTFGHTIFLISDGRIFGYPDTQNLKVAVYPPGDTTNRGYGRGTDEAEYANCQRVNICVTSGPSNTSRGVDAIVPTGCITEIPALFCNVYIYTGGGNSGWTPIGSGYVPDTGGNGGNGFPPGYIEGWSPPPNPCAGNSNRSNIVQDCNSAWVVIDDAPATMTPGDSLIAANLNRLYNKGLSLSNSLYDSAQADKDERTFTYVINGANDTIPMFPLRGSTYESWPQLAYNYMGIWHCHQDEGEANRNQSFDGADIFKLYYHYLINKGFPVSIITTHDYIYAAVVTDPIKFKSYIQNIAGTSDLERIKLQLNNIHQTVMNNCTDPACNWQKKSEKGTMAITANNNSDVSGVKIFKSSRQTINFTLLTQ